MQLVSKLFGRSGTESSCLSPAALRVLTSAYGMAWDSAALAAREQAREQVVSFIRQTFPEAMACIGFGSFFEAREIGPCADLDVAVFVKRGMLLRNRCLMVGGLPVDLRVLSAAAVASLRGNRINSSLRAILSAIADGTVMFDVEGQASGALALCRSIATEEINDDRAEAESMQLRWVLTNRMLDLIEAKSQTDIVVAAMAIYPLLLRLSLLRMSMKEGSPGQQLRRIAERDPALGGQIVGALQSAIGDASKEKLIEVVAEALNQAGGATWNNYVGQLWHHRDPPLEQHAG